MYNQFKKSIAVVLTLLTVFSMSMFSTAVTATINPLNAGYPGFYTSDGSSATENVRIGKTTSLNIKNMGTLQLDGNISGPKDIAVVVDNSVGTVTSPFSYSIVTEENLYAENSGIDIKGDIHSNANLDLNSNSDNISVTGLIEAVGTITENKVIQTESDKYKPNSNVIPFPTLSLNKTDRNIEIDKTYVSGSYEPVITDSAISLDGKEFRNDPRLGVSYTSPDGKSEHEGYYFKTNGSAFSLDTESTTVYFQNDGLILNGAYLNGNKQYIVAKNNIYIQGSELKSKDACIYSLEGDIDIGPGNVDFTGIIYAPKGEVRIHTYGAKIKGSIVAKSVYLASGNITIDNEVLDPTGIVHDTNQDVIDQKVKDAKDLTKQLLSKVQVDENVRMGVIACNSYAMPTTSSAIMKLYSTKVGSADRITLDKSIDSLSASGNADFNLGDGLRRAYHLLYGTGSITVPKYIIVLGYNAPNKYTVDALGDYQTNDQNPTPANIKSDSPTSTKSGLKYAETIINGYKNEKISINDPSGGTISLTGVNAFYPIFINYTGKGDLDPAYKSLEIIASRTGAKFYEYTAATGGDVLKEVENALLATVGEFTNVVYSFKLPKNAVLVDANKTIGNVTYGLSGDIVTITRRRIQLVYNGDIILSGIPYRNYIYNASVNVRVKFKRIPENNIKAGKAATIPVDFIKDNITGDRATVQYYLDYKDTSGNNISSRIDGTIKTGCRYNVIYKVDIG